MVGENASFSFFGMAVFLAFRKKQRDESFFRKYQTRKQNTKIAVRICMYRVISRAVAWLVVTMETVGQTNQPCVSTGCPPYLTIRSC